MVTVMAIAKVVAVFGKDRTVFVRYENSLKKILNGNNRNLNPCEASLFMLATIWLILYN